uniref:Uncharacterized protein n=1 Tax=Cajanus cajan TaxID=3821 RepID=A0A151R6H8_CAJCA|nr:hypothetical protein KK1_040538 [Cajanus cajan]
MTRFATAYLTLSCLHEMKASLMTMFSSEKWKKSKFGTSQEGRKIENIILDSPYWKNVTICLKVATPLMVVLLPATDGQGFPPANFLKYGGLR